MQNSTIPARGFLIIAVILSALNNPASGQGAGDDSEEITASFATYYARYYAPYALQAAAAYIPLAELNDTLGSTDGADVRRAVRDYPTQNKLQERAAKYLQPWRYQFGSEGYIECIEKNDPDCRRIIVDDRWAVPIPAGPTFHVWARYGTRKTTCNEVSIAFRGTFLAADWIGNVSPGWAPVDDHYRQLRRNVDMIIKKITGLPCYRGGTQLVSVGHSLGAGLAQFAALANNPGRPRIAKVFSFNASPVTGASLLRADVLKRNSAGLEIDRLYQPGEVLQYVRGAVEWFGSAPPRCGPLVRDIPFDVRRDSIVGLHGMAEFAGKLVQVSYQPNGKQTDYATPVQTCANLRYSPPASDEDRLPDEPAPQVARAPFTSPAALAQIDRDRMVDRDVRANFFGTADLQPAETAGSAVKLARHSAGRRVRTATASHHPSATARRVPAMHVQADVALRRD